MLLHRKVKKKKGNWLGLEPLVGKRNHTQSGSTRRKISDSGAKGGGRDGRAERDLEAELLFWLILNFSDKPNAISCRKKNKSSAEGKKMGGGDEKGGAGRDWREKGCKERIKTLVNKTDFRETGQRLPFVEGTGEKSGNHERKYGAIVRLLTPVLGIKEGGRKRISFHGVKRWGGTGSTKRKKGGETQKHFDDSRRFKSLC